MNYEEIKKELKDMQQMIECLIPDDINAALEHGKELAVYNARSGYLVAQAKELARKKKTQQISETIIKIAKEQFLSAKVQNTLLDSIASDEMYVVEWAERINAATVHQLDFVRSILSKAKEEMRLQGYVDDMNRMKNV